MNSHPPIFIVDDEEAVRISLARLLAAIGVPTETFPSATDFLKTYTPGRSGCLLVDLRMPGMSGLDLIHPDDRPYRRTIGAAPRGAAAFRVSREAILDTRAERSRRAVARYI
jgi:response regulator RpfG family c-di-GMP phosphodiesterase